MADIATPNPFELSWLTERTIATLADLQAARPDLRMAPDAHLIATGCSLSDSPAGHMESVVLGADQPSRHPVEYLPVALPGTGDLFTGLIVAGLARGLLLPQAVEIAQRLTLRALNRARTLGSGEVVLSDPNFRRDLVMLAPK